MIWLYGICDRPDVPVPKAHGLAQAPLEGIVEGELVAVFTRHEQPVGSATPDALWLHERVVERLMTDRTTLPVRFGSTVEDEPALRGLLSERQTALLALIARIHGRVELGVRVLESAEPAAAVTAPAASGREYMLAKVANGRRIAGLDAPLSELAVEARQQPLRREEVLRTSYLVERTAVGPFRSAVERLQHAHPELALLCTGPWPPYSFMEDAS